MLAVAVSDDSNDYHEITWGSRNCEAIWESSADPDVKYLLLYLSRFLDFRELDAVGHFKGQVWRSAARMAKELGWGLTKLFRVIKEAQEQGFIRRVWRKKVNGERACNGYGITELIFKQFRETKAFKVLKLKLKNRKQSKCGGDNIRNPDTEFPLVESPSLVNTSHPVTGTTQFSGGGGGAVEKSGFQEGGTRAAQEETVVEQMPTAEEKALVRNLDEILGIRTGGLGLWIFCQKLRSYSVASHESIKKDAAWLKTREDWLGEPTKYATRVFEVGAARNTYLRAHIAPLVREVNRLIRDQGVTLDVAQNRCFEAAGVPAVICADVRSTFEQFEKRKSLAPESSLELGGDGDG
jgi:hypothetical protein